MPESFGARLRQQREERGIALVTIAQQTRIKESLLEALERDDLSQWPSGFYRRAFFRAYASAIALDPDVAMREFVEVNPEPPEVDVVKAMAAALDRVEGSGMTAGIRDVVGSAIGSLSRLRRPPADDAPARTLVADAAPPVAMPSAEPDLFDIAHLCTQFGRVSSTSDAESLLQETAILLDATGIIVWLWDGFAAQLTPALVHGYSDKLIAQLPMVRRDADNATAAAFRSAQTRVLADRPESPGAMVVPLQTSAGCRGVLAIELRRGRPVSTPVLAAATIVAAQLAQMAGDFRVRAALRPTRLAAGGVPQGV